MKIELLDIHDNVRQVHDRKDGPPDDVRTDLVRVWKDPEYRWVKSARLIWGPQRRLLVRRPVDAYGPGHMPLRREVQPVGGAPVGRGLCGCRAFEIYHMPVDCARARAMGLVKYVPRQRER